MQNICNLNLIELEAQLKKLGEPSFRAKQVFSWIYKKGVIDFSQMSDLSEALRTRLQKEFSILDLELAKKAESADGTQKLLFELGGKDYVEAVIIPADARVTGCISSQVGCRFSCKFCASGLNSFKRNLTCGEILQEVLYLKNHSIDKKLTHIVFMGTGEPLDNYTQVLKAIRIINSDYAFHIGARRITISTCGLIPEIKKLMSEDLQFELSISLHCADDKTRSRLMPINNKYPVSELIKTCKEYFNKTKRQVTFEYLLIKNLNSDLQSALNLGRILQGSDFKVNLIPANAVQERGIEPPGKLEILFFRDQLIKAGIHVTLRKARGQDIDAACGQLRLRYENK
ncbi:MAG: 23S rRNA (adenine(2503)-C(2))-methyltransferase RlmN [Candidatus Omnitrophota bacterium]